ncbi:MAG: hypothetical protein HC767_08220 [Akkermansiaceae bacterium]|nr:hypothetical protein [Akkermansiaceae bacterium]
MQAEIGLSGLKEVLGAFVAASLRRLEINLEPKKRKQEPLFGENPKIISEKTTKSSSWLPQKAELISLDIQEMILKASLDQGPIIANGMSLRVESAGASDSYRGEITGGVMKLPFRFLPEIRLDRLKLRYQDHVAFLTNSQIQAWDEGLIEASGEWDAKSREFFLEGDANDLKCENLLNPDWAKRLTGNVKSSFLIHNRFGEVKANGKLTIQQGSLTALPVLDALAAYADTHRFRQLILTELYTDWNWEKNETRLSNLVLASEGLIRLEGQLTIRGEQIDGTFRIGLARAALTTIPGAEAHVFSTGERGLLWAPLHITGTLNDPKEDLTDRLLAAAGMRMIEQLPETGEKVIQLTQSVLGDSAAKTAEQGVKVIEEGSKVVKDAAEIFNTILGGDESGENPKKKEP